MWKGVLLSCWFGLLAGACSLEVGQAICSLCGREIHAETLVEIELADGEVYQVCCPRCRSRFEQRGDQIVRAMVADYVSREMIDATEAFYVEDSALHPCGHHEVTRDHAGTSYEKTWDRCSPSLIAFASREEARRFQSRHGGLLRRFEEVLDSP